MNKAWRYVIGLVLCAVAPILFVPTLYSLTSVGDCGDVGEQACPAGTATHIVVIMLASVLVVVGGILTMGTGIFLTVIVGGIEVLVYGHGTVAHIVGPSLIGFPVLLVVVGLIGARGNAKREAALEQFRARAVRVPGIVASITDTGVTINEDPKVALGIEYTREDGAPGRIERKQLVSRLNLPRVGDPVTVSYDPTGVEEAVFEFPDAAASAAEALATARTAGVTDAVPEPASGLIASLERLSALHREGALTDDEFASAKRRLLGA